ncbi:MAG: glycoside hydrolase/phage tail family protein [Pseudomonadota bacterium]
MGEIVLSRVGQIAGSALLPNGLNIFGLPLSGEMIGGALGRYAGRAIDAAILPDTEAARIKSLQVMESREGAALPKVYGRMRVGGQVIWASRFKERSRERQAGKGGPKYIDYEYSISFAVALGQGPITRVDRVWANGELFSLRDVTWRLYHGTRNQLPDPLIEAIEGSDQTPAYRDTAYIVFEDLPLDAFGNRMPQFSFEVVRAGDRATDPLATHVKGVNIIPASGEFVYATSVVRERRFPGIETALNYNSARGDADFVVSLDQLSSDLPNVEHAALTVAWFGDDLRAGTCRLRPGVERRDRSTVPYAWRVDQTDRAGAHLISQTDGGPNYGGTPADDAVLEGIAAMKAMGLAVTLSPFILMDVLPGNGLPDPRGWIGQPPFPWRGRITVSQDKTRSARDEVEAFVGLDGGFGFRHFILHHARLAVRAGGVDTFLLGSELVGLTRVRDEAGRFPFVEALQSLAAEVKAILGPDTKVSYAADWTEYGAYAPGDGSRDVLFPLDPLWASDAVDFVGVDWYPPCGDWRDGDEHLDALAGYSGADSEAYLLSQLAGGEAYDWYYGSMQDRDAQVRRPIIDGASGEHWVFRAKDLAGWWSAAHYPRPGGARGAQPTEWQPELKPIRLIEIGFPAVDKGANAPNVFVDPKSSESALPFYSNGTRDDLIQRRALTTALSYWQAQPCIEQALVWAWDGRPWPDFPAREDVWSDGPNWQFGHWLNGRTGLMELSDSVQDIARDAEIELASDDLDGVIDGYLIDGLSTPAAALTPLSLAFDFSVRETEEGLVAVHKADASVIEISEDTLLQDGRRDTLTLLNAAPTGLRLNYISGDFSYQPATAQFRNSGAGRATVINAALPLVLTESRAASLCEALYQQASATRTSQLHLSLAGAARLEVADGVRFDGTDWRIQRIEEELLSRKVTLKGLTQSISTDHAISVPDLGYAASYPANLEFRVIDIADLTGSTGPAIAVSADPWGGAVPIRIGATTQSLRQIATATQSALMGELRTDLPAGAADVWDDESAVEVWIPNADLSSAEPEAVLDGLNRLIIETQTGWTLLCWTTATLLAADTWRLSGLRRGLLETSVDAIDESATVIVADDRLVELPLSAAQTDVDLYLQVGGEPPITFRFDQA